MGKTLRRVLGVDGSEGLKMGFFGGRSWIWIKID